MQLLTSISNTSRRLVAPLASFPGLALINSTVRECLTNADMQARCISKLHTVVNYDVIFPMMDLTVEAEALGATVDWETDLMPVIKGKRIETIDDTECMVIPSIRDDNRLGIFVDTCRQLRESFPNRTIWAYALGPFSIAGRLMGMTELAIAVKLEQKLLHTTLKKCNELLKMYIRALLDTGVDGLMILEPASSLLREDDANEFSNSYIRELVDLIKDRGKTPALHNCGSIAHLIESLCATGIEVLSIGSAVNAFDVYSRLPADVFLMGNLDPTELFLRGTPEKVRSATAELIDRMANCERFIISSGCDVPPGTSVENLIAFESASAQREQIIA